MMHRNEGKIVDKEEERLRRENDQRTQEALDRLSTTPRKNRTREGNASRDPVERICQLEWLRNKGTTTASRRQTNAGEPSLLPVKKKELDDYFSGTNRSGNTKQRGKKRERIEIVRDISQLDGPKGSPVAPAAPINRRPPPPPQAAPPPPPENAWAKKPGAALFPGSSSATVVALGVTEYNEKEMLAKALVESIRTAEQEIVLRAENPLPLLHANGYAAPTETEPRRYSSDSKDTSYGYRTDSYRNGIKMEDSNFRPSNGPTSARNSRSPQNGNAEKPWDAGENVVEESDLFSLASTEGIGQESCPKRGNDSQHTETVSETSLTRQFEACSLQQDSSSSGGGANSVLKDGTGDNNAFMPNVGKQRQISRLSSEMGKLQPSSNDEEPLSRRDRFAGDPPRPPSAKTTGQGENGSGEQPTPPEQTAASASPGREEETGFTPEHFIVMVKDDIPETPSMPPSYSPYPTMPYEDFSNFAYDGSYPFAWGTSGANYMAPMVDIPGETASPTMSQPNYFSSPAVNYNFVPSGNFQTEAECEPEREALARSPDFNPSVNQQVSASHFQNAVSSGFEAGNYNSDVRELLMLREQSISPQPGMQHRHLEQMENSRQQPNQTMFHSQLQHNQFMLQPGQGLNLQQENIQSMLPPVRANDSQQSNQPVLQFSQQQLNQSTLHSQQLPNQSLLSQAASSRQQSVQPNLHQPQHEPNKSSLQPEQMYAMRLPTQFMNESGQVVDSQLQSGMPGNSAGASLQTLLQSGQVDNAQNMFLGNLSGIDARTLQLNLLLSQQLLLSQLSSSLSNSASNNAPIFTTTTPLPSVPQTPMHDASGPSPPLPPLPSLPPPFVPKEAANRSVSSNNMNPYQEAPMYMQSGSPNMQNGSNYAAQPAGHVNHIQLLGMPQGCGRGRGTGISSPN